VFGPGEKLIAVQNSSGAVISAAFMRWGIAAACGPM
jgi:hypothetical protein